MRTGCKHLGRTFAVAFCAGLLSQPVWSQCGDYEVVVLAGPPCQFEPSDANASAVNPNGDLCGNYYTCGESGESGVWIGDGWWIELPTAPGYTGLDPRDMNSSRVMAGNTATLQNPGMSIAAIYDFETGTMTSLGTLPGGNRSEGHAINASGVACGLSTNSVTGPHQAFIYQNGRMSALNLPLGPASEANDISDTGLVCGWMGSSGLAAHAFLWSSTGTVDLGTVLPGAIAAHAKSVNDAGSVCGLAVLEDPKYTYLVHGFLWHDGIGQDLGILPGYLHVRAYAINSSNVVIGYLDDWPVQEQPSSAFVWRNGAMMKLTDLIPGELNLHIDIVWSINDAGQIAGQAKVMDQSGDRVAVRLTPLPSTIGDFNCDSAINVNDLLGVINSWGASQASAGNTTLHPADFNHDGIVNVADLLIVLDNWTF